MGTHLRVLSESYLMNTNMTGKDDFQKYLRPCALEESSLSIGRVKVRYLVYQQLKAGEHEANVNMTMPQFDKRLHIVYVSLRHLESGY